MMVRSKHWAAYVRIFCAIALLFVGFAHKPPQISTASLSPAELASLVLPDGSLPDLCLPGHEDEGSGLPHGTMGSGCEACRLAGTVLLPSPADNAWLLSVFANLGAVKPLEPPVRLAYVLDRPRLRGPPLSA